MKTFQYTVTGRGQFPLDMLRYDAAWPLDPDKIVHSFNREVKPEQYTVRLHSVRPPTVDRWNSFGWYVDPQSIRKL